MAITANCSKFLFYSKSLGVSFEKTLTLGRLNLYAKPTDISEQIALFKNNAKKITDVNLNNDYAEPLFQILGAANVDSMDYSDYEKATIIHDLNKPVGDNLKDRFTAIVDGGTIEHVFNFPVAIRNCMEMLKDGGHYIGITPANNLMGHGFYQFSPELYFRVFSPEFGFIAKKICLVTQNSDNKFSDWYEIMDPVKVKNRVMIINSKETFLLVLAQKIRTINLENFIPQQSDYKAIWSINTALKEDRPPEGESKVKYIYRKYFPLWGKKIVHKIFLGRKRKANEDLGLIDPEHFKKIIF